VAKKAIVMPFGVREMDERLLGGGLPYGALDEIAGGGAGTVDGAAAALFAAGIAARAKGKVLWCLTRPDLFFSAIAQAGLHPDRVIFWGQNKSSPKLYAKANGLRTYATRRSSAGRRSDRNPLGI
jgi:protein ImuA